MGGIVTRAIILAAGRGSRMEQLTANQPKCLTVFDQRSLLDWQIDSLKKAGIVELAIVRGYLGSMLQLSGITYFENPLWNKSNMVYSLLCADQWLSSNPCVICYSDIVFHPEIIKALAANESDIAIAYDPAWLNLWSLRFDDPLSDAETFQCTDNHLLSEIGRKAKTLNEIRGQYMGLLKFHPRGWFRIRDWLYNRDESFIKNLDMTSLLRNLLIDGQAIYCVENRYRWLEVDSRNDLELYNKTFSNGKLWSKPVC